jgi:GntR family transcriptional regulator
MGTIDHSSFTPLYAQVIQYLQSKIDSGEEKEGDTIPSENALAKELGVSRITVINAIKHMVQEGSLYRIQGKGTFVASREKRVHHLTILQSFSEDMLSQGYEPTNRLLEFASVKPEQPIAQALQLDSSETAWAIKRIRYADGEPMAIQTAYLPEKIFPGLTSDMVSSESLYKTLIDAYKIQMDEAEEKYSIVFLRNETDTELLGVAYESPALHSTRIARLSDGRVFEYTDSILRGDRYVLSLKMKAQ